MSARAYIIRHWRGDLPLVVSYWVNGALVGVAAAVATRFIANQADVLIVDRPRTVAAAVLITLGILIALSWWQIIGIFRSAKKYIAAGKAELWGRLAQLAAVLGAMNFGYELAFSYVPQTLEYVEIAAGRDRYGKYEIQQRGEELEVSGAIAFGLAAAIGDSIKDPRIRIIRLNSDGGRVAEARALGRMIEEKGLITFTSERCMSACTIAFMAGRERWISANAVLGFHGYGMPGLTNSEANRSLLEDIPRWVDRGISADFLEKAMRVSNDSLWTPSREELLDSKVVTKIAACAGC